MELKPFTNTSTTSHGTLLIVPYGIETCFSIVSSWLPFPLLIVPYGIETRKSSLSVVFLARLLIVPYGIETLLEYYQEQGKRLLIVPYGIETNTQFHQFSTLFLLIVPYGIETELTTANRMIGTPFNRTLWNWNGKPTSHIKGTSVF